MADQTNGGNSARWRAWVGRTIVLAGMVLVICQLLTFKAVVQRHTLQAQQLSRSVGWFGQPVGTMPQPVTDVAQHGALAPMAGTAMH